MVTCKPNIAYSLMPSPVITLNGMSMTESAQISCIATSWSNVKYVTQTGGSTADEGVTEAADEYGMVMTHTGFRLFFLTRA